jgi:hypothetical protein
MAMFQGYQKHAWDHTAFLISVQCADNKHPFAFNPYRTQPKRNSAFTGRYVGDWSQALMKQGMVPQCLD